MSDQYNSLLPQGFADPFTKKVNKEQTHKNCLPAEDAPAFASLRSHNLLITSYRKETFDDIFDATDLTPNSSHRQNFKKRMKWGVYWTPGCGFLFYRFYNKEVVVPPGHVCCFIDDENNYLFAKPGVHNIENPFIKRVSTIIGLNGSDRQCRVIRHGNRSLLTIPQGTLGYATDMGKSILLPPGLHSWTSETLRFENMHRLDGKPVLVIGPYTLVTVDQGYVGVSSNDGKLHILDAGRTHLLTHQKWRFDRFLNVETQHDDLKKVRATTADYVLIDIHATVTWRIEDVIKVATKLSESPISDASAESSDDGFAISSTLRRDILRLVDAALSTFIGRINFAEFYHDCFSKSITNGDDNSSSTSNLDNTSPSFGLRNNEKIQNRYHDSKGLYDISNSSLASHTFDESVFVSVSGNRRRVENPFFDSKGIGDAILKANHMTRTFGIEIMDICLISANPSDDHLVASLAAAAVSSAETYRRETEIKGYANAKKIEAEADTNTRRIHVESDAKVSLIQAKADADAVIARSEGAKQAAIQ